MYGAVMGDIIGSIYEFDNHKSKAFPLFTDGSHFTDDTVCTIAIADALLNNRDFAGHLRAWGNHYPDAGYGGMFRKWLRDSKMPAYRSWGNGAAMRISPVALMARSTDELMSLATAATSVTHNHPESFRGACATAVATWHALRGMPTKDLRSFIRVEYKYDLSRSVDEIRPQMTFDVSCQGTVPAALTCALEAGSYVDAIRNAVSIGGDTDTICAIAGALAEAMFGIPSDLIQKVQSRLPEEMTSILDQLYDRQSLR